MVPAAACQNHLEREAIGICVECRGRMCGECVTKVDGINYCASCLAMLAERTKRKDGARRAPSARWLGAAVLFVTATALVWGLLETALPGGS